MLLLPFVTNELSRLLFFCTLSEQARRFLFGTEQHNKGRLLVHGIL